MAGMHFMALPCENRYAGVKRDSTCHQKRHAKITKKPNTMPASKADKQKIRKCRACHEKWQAKIAPSALGSTTLLTLLTLWCFTLVLSSPHSTPVLLPSDLLSMFFVFLLGFLAQSLPLLSLLMTRLFFSFLNLSVLFLSFVKRLSWTL